MSHSKQPGLDSRRRNNDRTTRAKRGDTQIGTLRRTYGEHFAAGYRSDMRLKTLLQREGVDSLNGYLKKVTTQVC